MYAKAMHIVTPAIVLAVLVELASGVVDMISKLRESLTSSRYFRESRE
jgi:hypothetical protein